ncbi:hypothetical protein LY76DRAFT_139674 [Colletotrichum caudatum]|nr:hypothetical protein LY76DRAFT_139674 [Colletotrichum caudatum]
MRILGCQICFLIFIHYISGGATFENPQPGAAAGSHADDTVFILPNPSSQSVFNLPGAVPADFQQNSPTQNHAAQDEDGRWYDASLRLDQRQRESNPHGCLHHPISKRKKRGGKPPQTHIGCHFDNVKEN